MDVLVDTSVWIDHLRKGSDRLTQLLEASRVVCHPFVIGEIACGSLSNRSEVLSLLGALPGLAPVSNEEAMFFIESKRLMGRGLGFIDVHLLASAMLADIPILTRDQRLKTAAADLGLVF